MKYIYGPVKSRRLGLSLGVSLTEPKTCSFDCVYCQLGRTTHGASKRKDYVKVEDIIVELKDFLSSSGQKAPILDYIALSGFGEPLLNINIATLINEIKMLTAIPLALITNSSLFINPDTRRDVLGLDLILPSLDAVTQGVFEQIDRPVVKLEIEDIINGLVSLRREFKGRIYLEIMLIKGINDSLDYAVKFRETVSRIGPDKIQLNTPARLTAEGWIEVPEQKRLLEIRDILGPRCELIGSCARSSIG